MEMRQECLISGISDLEPLFTLHKFPIFMGVTSQPVELDEMEDMTWAVSKSSGLIQLKTLIELERLYPEQTTTLAIGKAWKEHHESFARFISNYSPSSILEIGGAHGLLSVEFTKNYSRIPWMIVEPNPHPVPECEANFISDFFENQERLISPEMTVVHSHTLEHIYDPLKFINSISRQMAEGQRMIMSIPHLEEWFRRGHSNALNFEHTYLLTMDVLEILTESAGFTIESRFDFRDTHSIFLSLVRTHSARQINLDKLPVNVGADVVFKRLFEEKKDFVELCNSQLQNEVAPIFIFGAHIFTQQLLNLGLNSNKIISILDNDPNKHGARLYGTKLMVESPNVISIAIEPIVILDVGEYADEVCAQLIQLNDKVKLLKFIPS